MTKVNHQATHTNPYLTILGLVGLLYACRSNIPPVGTPVIEPDYPPIQYDGDYIDSLYEYVSPPTFAKASIISEKTIRNLLKFTDDIDATNWTLYGTVTFSVDENGTLTIKRFSQSSAIHDQIKQMGNKLLDSIVVTQPAHLVNDIKKKTPYFFHVRMHIYSETVTFRIVGQGNRSLLDKTYTRPLH